jgi:hypothetical protein
MNQASSRAATLAARARAAAESRSGSGTSTEVMMRDPEWAARARYIARQVADLLGVGFPDLRIRINQSPVRGGQMPWISLTVADGAAEHAFTVPYHQPERILACVPCPDCGNLVPTRQIACLADLGQLIADLEQYPPRPGDYRDREGFQLPPEFDCIDHDLSCAHFPFPRTCPPYGPRTAEPGPR